MLVSKNLMGERTQDSLQVFPGHEAIVGVYLASKAGKKDGKTKDFKDVNEALSAYEKGQVGLGEKVRLAKSGPKA
jgi:hypothetical protein